MGEERSQHGSANSKVNGLCWKSHRLGTEADSKVGSKDSHEENQNDWNQNRKWYGFNAGILMQ